MAARTKWHLLVLAFCLLVAVAGCTNDAALPTDIPEEVISADAADDENLLTENEVNDKEDLLECTDYSEAYKAYLEVLMEKGPRLTNELFLESPWDAIVADMGDGKIAILDVLGDETPELMYLYATLEAPIYTNRICMDILSYSLTEGVEWVFAGLYLYSFYSFDTDKTYCIYLTNDGELMYYFNNKAVAMYAFIQITEELYDSPSFDLAKLFYTYNSQQKEFHYEHYGKEITEEQFNQISTEIIEGIDQVIFQGVGDDLYQDHVWYGLTPFKEECMTYMEAVAWLDAQIEMAQ